MCEGIVCYLSNGGGAHPDGGGTFVAPVAVVSDSVVIRRAAVQGIQSIGRAMMQRVCVMRCIGDAAGGSRGTADLMRTTVERALGDRKHDVTMLAQPISFAKCGRQMLSAEVARPPKKEIEGGF